MRATSALLLLGSALLLSAGIHRDESPMPAPDHAAPLDEPHLTFTSAPGRVLVSGTTISAVHEQELRRAVADQFRGAVAVDRFRPGVLAAGWWESTSTALVHTIAALESASAEMRPGAVVIRGVGSETAAFSARVDRLRDSLPADVALTTDVVVLTSRVSFDELCARAFASLALEPVSFHESSAEIRPASLVALDRITEFARDCPSVTIAITGHTDGSGDETWNRRLSLARARSVADHIASNGIDPARLVTSGLGSSVPIADNSTARGREQNRRIEFELR